jgi:ATP-dependent Clp protease ATP-binding subunit ClpA
MNLCKDPDLMPESEGIAKAQREPLLKAFPAALLGRLVVIPYYPLNDEIIGAIARLQLGRIEKRIREQHRGSRLSPYYMYSPWRGVASGERFGYLTAPMSWLSCS